MQITCLEIENFLSYKEASIELADRGLVLIEGENRDQGGSNGAGKTTLFEAICWALFQRLNNGLRGDDIRRTGSKGTRVSVTLDIDGRRVEVHRHRAHPEFINALHVFVDGEDVRGANDRETQARLSRLLGLDWNSFISVVLFPQGKQGIASWTDGEQKTVLDTVLSLGRFGEARSRVVTMIERDQFRLKELDTKELMLIQAQGRANGQLKTLEEKAAGFEAERDEELQIYETQLCDHALLEPEPAEPFQTKLDELRKQLEEARQPDVLNMLDQLAHQLEVVSAEQVQDEIAEEIESKHGLVVVLDPQKEAAAQEDCPSCGQVLPKKALAQLLRGYERMAQEQREDNEARRESLRVLKERIDGRTVQLKELRDLFELTTSKTHDTSALEDEVSKTERELLNQHNNMDIWLREKKDLVRRRDQVKARVDPYQDLIKAEQVRLIEIDTDLENCRKELQPLRDDIQYLEFWKDGFGKGGVKNLLLSTVTPFLNERANLYMDGLSRSTASILIKTQKAKRSGGFSEKLDFRVTYNNAGSIYAAKSGGEKRRADLAILFALGDLASARAHAPVDLRLLDEPFENLDSLGCEQVVELLMEHVVPRSKTVFVMSHNEDLKSLFEQRIVVVKENGISFIR